MFEDELLRAAKRGSNNKLDIHEFKRAQWTFHSKGMWINENDSDENITTSVIGSSNFSYRSLRRDNEAQFYIYSMCPEFQKQLKKEQESQYSHCEVVTEKNLRKDEGMEFGWITIILAKLLRSFLIQMKNAALL